MSITNSSRVDEVQKVVTGLDQKAWWVYVLLCVLSSFLIIQAFGALSMVTLVPAKGLTGGATDIPDINGLDGIQMRFVRWDSGYYLDIIKHGYAVNGSERAFYPLYPLLVAGINRLLGIQVFWSGLIISTLCYVAASLLLYRWVLLDYSQDVARWTVLWLCLFPMSFFLIAFYAEPLLLLTTIAALYFVRRGNFIASGACIALAGATRSFAFLLAVPYIVEFFYQRKFDLNSWLKFVAGALIAPLGTIAYFVFLAVQSGSINLLEIQRSTTLAWSDFYFAWPWWTWIDAIRAALFGARILPDWFSRALSIQDLTYAGFGLALSVWAFFHLRPYLSAFLIAGMLFFSINHGPAGYAFWSMPRHVAALVPIYLGLALLTLKLPTRYRWLPVSLSAAMLGFLSLWFVRGGWVS